MGFTLFILSVPTHVSTYQTREPQCLFTFFLLHIVVRSPNTIFYFSGDFTQVKIKTPRQRKVVIRNKKKTRKPYFFLTHARMTHWLEVYTVEIEGRTRNFIAPALDHKTWLVPRPRRKCYHNFIGHYRQ